MSGIPGQSPGIKMTDEKKDQNDQNVVCLSVRTKLIDAGNGPGPLV